MDSVIMFHFIMMCTLHTYYAEIFPADLYKSNMANVFIKKLIILAYWQYVQFQVFSLFLHFMNNKNITFY